MEQYIEIAKKIQEADAILIGASNGLSITEGLHLFANNAAFEEVLGDFRKNTDLEIFWTAFFGTGKPWKKSGAI